MSNPWKKVPEPVSVANLSDIMSEEIAKGLQLKEDMKLISMVQNTMSNEELSTEILKRLEESNVKEYCDSDSIIAKVLQNQYDEENDDEVERIQKKRNGDSKVSVSYDNYRYVPRNLLYDSEGEEEDVYIADKKDWDRFETNEKEFASIPKCGYIVKNGAMITKHDSVINGRRNAGKVMSLPPEVCTGDGGNFDMRLSNPVFNHLKASTSTICRKNKKLDKKESQETAEKGLDESTKMIIYKLRYTVSMLEAVNGIISTGKESIVLHANCDMSYTEQILPKECAIKVFITTLSEFKTRDKYIQSDHRFKDRYSKQNPRKIVHMWAEKEMRNMIRLDKLGINCPKMIALKKHVLVMSFIGRDNKPAPKLKNAILTNEEWCSVYKEVIDIMRKMYIDVKMIHADFSEYNILWHDNKCYVIDVSQSVQPDHPNANEFLLRDCRNISHFFMKKDVPDVKSAEDLFEFITSFKISDLNLCEGVHSGDSRIESNQYDYWQGNSDNKQGQGNKDHSYMDISDNEDDKDGFEDMWEHSIKQKHLLADIATNIATEVAPSVENQMEY